MNLEFKSILLKIAKLTGHDQKWLLGQLSEEQLRLFQTHQGKQLLEQAKRFKGIKYQSPVQTTKTSALPQLCHDLAQRPPLYTAIILELGQFSWTDEFLESFQLKERLAAAQYPIKVATKKLIFEQWQAELSFEDQLDVTHG